jgi:hypothetical protein
VPEVILTATGVNPFDPVNPYFQFVRAGPSGGCRSGEGPRFTVSTFLDTDLTD